jgi:hypothetical protein
MAKTQFDNVVQDIIDYTALGMNVMLIGRHGVGKTSAVQAACKKAGLNMWYASAPLLDPDIDLGGIPVPDHTTGNLRFFTQPQLFDAEVIFLDELNRASPRTLNMIFELVQFKSIHGKRLPKLKAVHTGINPPGQGQYDVQTLDDALLDRFHAFIEMKAEFPMAIMLPLLGEAKADAFKTWSQQHLTDVFVSPRRMVYAAELYAAGMDIARAFTEAKVPVGRLKTMLADAGLAASGIEKVVKEIPIWEEEKFQIALNHPLLQEDHKELARVMKELGVTAEQVWTKVAELRAAKAAKEGK